MSSSRASPSTVDTEGLSLQPTFLLALSRLKGRARFVLDSKLIQGLSDVLALAAVRSVDDPRSLFLKYFLHTERAPWVLGTDDDGCEWLDANEDFFAGKDTPLVEVRESGIAQAGRGVFAARDIPKGTVVAVYAGHTGLQEKKTSEEGEYTLTIASDRHIDGFVAPRTTHGVAQLINDAVCVHEATRDGIYQYVRESTQLANVSYTDEHGLVCPFVIAKRDIKKGEELFHSYGCIYWMCRKGMNIDEIHATIKAHFPNTAPFL